MKSALVVDADPVDQHRVSQILYSLWPQIDLALSAGVDDGHTHLAGRMPDLLITDFYLPDGSGLTLVEQTLQRYPQVPRVLVTRHDDNAHLFTALQYGVDGYLLKAQSDDDLRQRFAAIDRGEPSLAPDITRQILREFRRQPALLPDTGQPVAANIAAADLSQREAEVLRLLTHGWDRHQVAEALAIQPSTVAGHVKTIYLKLNISTRAEAALAAVRLGLVELEA